MRRKVCPCKRRNLQISCDGMSESKSSSVSLDVYSSKYKSCKAIFPHKIVKPLKKAIVDPLKQFSDFIEDLISNEMTIDEYVADNLKRATGKNCLNRASNFPCEYCFSKAVRFTIEKSDARSRKGFNNIRDKLRELMPALEQQDINAITSEIDNAEKQIKEKRHSHLVWPSSTMNGEPRTTEKIRDLVNAIENGEPLTPDEAMGVLGPSPLLNLENFDFVVDSPAEYLHSCCLGVSKRLVELTFNVGSSRPRKTKRKLCSAAEFNKLMQFVKVVREFSRRIRDLDFSVYKRQKFRNLSIFFFPIIIKCIQPGEKERKLWLLYAYMIRSCVVPQKEFKNISIETVVHACEQFYRLYEKLFGEQNCTYNTHVVGAHLVEIRHKGPLTSTSAFCFEAFYGEIRNSFVPGTQSTLKQIFKKVLLKRALTYHTCENSIYYSDHETAMENNTLIYCYKDQTHKIFKVFEVTDTHVICFKQGRTIYSFPDLPNYDFSKVGVYKKGLISDEKVKISISLIDGKVLEVDNLLITCPNNVLREK